MGTQHSTLFGVCKAIPKYCEENVHDNGHENSPSPCNQDLRTGDGDSCKNPNAKAFVAGDAEFDKLSEKEHVWKTTSSFLFKSGNNAEQSEGYLKLLTYKELKSLIIDCRTVTHLEKGIYQDFPLCVNTRTTKASQVDISTLFHEVALKTRASLSCKSSYNAEQNEDDFLLVFRDFANIAQEYKEVQAYGDKLTTIYLSKLIHSVEECVYWEYIPLWCRLGGKKTSHTEFSQIYFNILCDEFLGHALNYWTRFFTAAEVSKTYNSKENEIYNLISVPDITLAKFFCAEALQKIELDFLDTHKTKLFNELSNSLQDTQFRELVVLWDAAILEDFKLHFHGFFKTENYEEHVKICDTTVPQVISISEGTLQYEFQHDEQPCFVDNYAKMSDLASDPPGQQSVYIPPGDVRKEAYRLSTFDNFPRNITVSIVQLAKQGFHYTGYLDRVKCYSCGRTVEKFEPSDAAEDRRYHKSDCAMLQGGANDNIPIGGFLNKRPRGLPNVDATTSRMSQNASSSALNHVDSLVAGGSAQVGSVHVNTNGPVQTLNGPLRNAATSSGTRRQWRLANIISSDHRRYLTNLHLNREIDRLATFSRWPITRPNVAPVDVAKAGFFYLGDMDRTQCFSCGGVLRNWTRDDNAMDEHRTHFGNCRFVLGTDNRNVPVPVIPETQAQMTANYPCQHPTNPHMRSEHTRLATFDSRWPSVRTRATPEQIAEAGFFYLGERDRVKCWYCNGGLQNWEYDDIPWVEHAKWFPSCQFLLRNKGQHFVYRHLSVSPHLPRPVIGRQAGSTIDPVQPGQQRGQDIPPPISRARAPTPPPTIIDPQEEMRRRKEEVDKEIRENTGVRIVIDMGFDEEVVRKVLEERLEYLMSAEDQMDHIRTKIFDNTEQLLNAVQGREAEIRRELEEEREATRLKEIQQSQEPMSVAYSSVSSNYSTFEMSAMETAPSMASQASGVNNVSGFPIDSDEEGYIYGSMPQGATAAAASTTVPTSMSEIQSYGLDIPEDPASLKDMIERKKEEGQCKICFTEAANMVFMPCSHMCCCKNCTEAIKYCPVCRKKINRAIIVYLE